MKNQEMSPYQLEKLQVFKELSGEDLKKLCKSNPTLLKSVAIYIAAELNMKIYENSK